MHVIGHANVDALGNPAAEQWACNDHGGDTGQRAKQNDPAQISAQQVGHGDGTGGRRHEAVGDRQTGQQRDTVVEQRAPGFLRQSVDQRHQNNETDVEKDRDGDQEPGQT